MCRVELGVVSKVGGRRAYLLRLVIEKVEMGSKRIFLREPRAQNHAKQNSKAVLQHFF
jgi:hypothetical protein